jgi:hypothetical protein
LPPDGGFAVGAGYRQTLLLRGLTELHVRGIVSTKSYEHLDLRLYFPRSDALVFGEFGLRYRNYPEEDFWGLGGKSWESLRTTFRLEDLNTTGAIGVSPWWFLRAGVRGGYLDVNIGPGRDEDRPSIEQIFAPPIVPGLERQTDFWHYGAFLTADYRDDWRDPTRGGLYSAEWTRYLDQKIGRYDFSRLNIDLRQYFPGPQPDATVAARAMWSFSRREPGNRVPFWMQPTVGGGNDVRGYLQYRFRDENSFVANLEYRWRFFGLFQALAFADAGRVFSSPGDLGLNGIRGSVGVGGRFKLGRALVLGLDLAWSPEGVRLWYRGSQMF